MATHRVLRRFPYNLNIGTDICHVVRIRSILASSRGRRFVDRILTADERRHPKIQRFLDVIPTQDAPLGENGEPISRELQTAATFLAGRYVYCFQDQHVPVTDRSPQIRRQRSCHQSPPTSLAHVAPNRHNKPAIDSRGKDRRSHGRHQRCD